MKWFDGYRMRLVLVGFVAAVVLCVGPVKADFTFGEPMNLGPEVNTSSTDGGPNISADGLSLFFHSNRPGGYGERDILVTTRPSINEPWGEPVNLGPPINTSARDAQPSVSSDRLSLFFASARSGGSGDQDLWVTRRKTRNDPWGEPVNLGPTINSSYRDSAPNISADRLSLFFHSNRPGGYGDFDLWLTTRISTEDDWATPVNLGPGVNSSAHDAQPSVSSDRLSLFFHSARSGGSGSQDLWVTRRKTRNDPWGEPVNLGFTVNSSTGDWGPDISPDGFTLYFGSGRPGGVGSLLDLWQVSITSIVDLNGDGIVDSADMYIMSSMSRT